MINPILQPPMASPRNNKLVAIILFSFLTTFVLARLVVYLVLSGALPNLFLTIKGVHVHHFTYGVVILAITQLYLLLKRPQATTAVFKLLTLLYGIGLGLTFDEFGMWVRLQDTYWIRQSYDAITIITLLLLNIVYYRWVIRALKEIISIIKKIILTVLPIKYYRYIRRQKKISGAS